MAPYGGVVDISSEKTVDGRGRQKLHILASIIPTGQARLARIADDVGFNCDSVARFEVLDVGVGSNYCAGGLVAQDVISVNNHGSDAARMPEVNIGSM